MRRVAASLIAASAASMAGAQAATLDLDPGPSGAVASPAPLNTTGPIHGQPYLVYAGFGLDIYYGYVHSSFRAFDGRLYFNGTHEDFEGTWTTTGRPGEATPFIISPVDPTQSFSPAYAMAALNISGDLAYFTGTEASTTLVSTASPRFFYDAHKRHVGGRDSRIFFSAGNELWQSDLTFGGTSMALPDVSVSQATTFDGELYFAGNSLDIENGARGASLWRTVADTTDVELVWDATLGNPYGSLGGMVGLDDRLLFFANSDRADLTYGQELWAYDAGSGQVGLIKDITPGVDSTDYLAMRRLGGRAVFFVDRGLGGNGLWASDGTTGGTAAIANLYLSESHFTVR